MSMRFKYTALMCWLAAGLGLLAGCEDEDEWTPGPLLQQQVNQVYFNDGDPAEIELPKQEGYDCTITLSREDSTEAISVPLSVVADEGFEVPAQAEFAAGEKTAQITVRFAGSETAGYHNCTVKIGEGGFNSPYTSLASSVLIKVRVTNWELYAENVKFHCNNYGDFGAQDLPDFTADLYKMEGMDLYRFENFMQGYNLDFTVVEAKKEDSGYYLDGDFYIHPEKGSYGKDNWGYEVWYFDEKLGKDDFPLYWVGDDASYLNNCCLFMGAEFYYTYINFKEKYVYFMGYFRQFDVVTGKYQKEGYCYIDGSWK